MGGSQVLQGEEVEEEEEEEEVGGKEASCRLSSERVVLKLVLKRDRNHQERKEKEVVAVKWETKARTISSIVTLLKISWTSVPSTAATITHLGCGNS